MGTVQIHCMYFMVSGLNTYLVKLQIFNVESSTILSWLPQLCKSLHAELHYDSMNIIDKTQETVSK